MQHQAEPAMANGGERGAAGIVLFPAVHVVASRHFLSLADVSLSMPFPSPVRLAALVVQLRRRDKKKKKERKA